MCTSKKMSPFLNKYLTWPHIHNLIVLLPGYAAMKALYSTQEQHHRYTRLCHLVYGTLRC